MPTVEIEFRATDETGGAIESARQGAVGLRKDITATGDAYDSYSDQLRANAPALKDNQRLQRLNTLAFKEQHEVLFDSIDVVSGVGHSFLKLAHIFTAYNTMQTRVGDQEERLQEAQQRTLEMIARYGPNSEQAIKARKAEAKEQEKLNRVQQEGQIQALSYGVASLSMASDITHVAGKINKLRFAVGQRGGIGSMLGDVFGGGPSLASGISPLAGGKGGGLLSRMGGMRGLGMMAAGGMGMAATQMFQAGMFGSSGSQQGDKLIGTLGSVGSGALMGASFGSIGAAIGAAGGLGLGLYQNYGQEFGNLFAGKGFVPNSPMSGSDTAMIGTGQGVNMGGSTIYIYTNSIADVNQFKAQLESEARKHGG